MTISKAQQEFRIRCYLWATSEFEKEINNSFPNLRLFRSGSGWKLCHFMQRLKPSDQSVLAHGRLKLWYPEQIKELGVEITDEEKSLAASFAEFALQPSSREFQILSRKRAGEKVKFASKRKLRRAIVSKLIEAYGSHWVHTETDEGWDPQFHMRCCGWIINTQLVLGRRQGVVWYRHIIESEARIPHRNIPQVMVPVATLSPGVAWFENRWEDVLDDEVEAVCNGVLRITGFFFEAAPRLLKGLEFDKLDPFEGQP